MKKVVSIALMMALCLALAIPAFAAGEGFVPSIGYKDHPEVIKVFEVLDDGTVIDTWPTDALIIVPISDVLNKTDKELTADEKKMFEDLYNDLLSGDETIPYPDGDSNKVIRDFFFAKLIGEERIKELEKDDIYISITFDVGIGPDEEITVMRYNDGEWLPATSVVNNGDGTITVILDILGVIAFSVPTGTDTPVTGDNSSSNNLVWVIVMVSSAAALVAVVVSRRKITDK